MEIITHLQREESRIAALEEVDTKKELLDTLFPLLKMLVGEVQTEFATVAEALEEVLEEIEGSSFDEEFAQNVAATLYLGIKLVAAAHPAETLDPENEEHKQAATFIQSANQLIIFINNELGDDSEEEENTDAPSETE